MWQPRFNYFRLVSAPCVQVCAPVFSWSMALIEGVGDEVTLLFGLLLLLLILLLAWISTGTSEPPEHLFVSATAPTPLLGSSPAQRDSLLSSADTSASSSSSSSTSSVSENSQAEVPPSTASNQEAKDEEGGRAEALGQGLRSRDRGGGGGDGEGGGESSSSQRNMVVRLKFLNDTERTAQVKPQDTIGYIKRWALNTQTPGMQRHNFFVVPYALRFVGHCTVLFEYLNILLTALSS